MPPAPDVIAAEHDTSTPHLDSDLDSIYTTSTCDSETTSITDSVLEYVHENGRRYVSERWDKDKYLIPNDEPEQERMDIIHHMFLQLLRGKLTMAPLDAERGGRCLDLGTGTGIWAVEFADSYPKWSVLGTDLSPIQPTYLPPNCKFELEDFEQPWTLNIEKQFDFIHIRYLVGAVKDWKSFLQKCFAYVKPGGFIEISELDITRPTFQADGLPGTAIKTYTHHLGEAAAKAGARMDIVPTLAGLLGEVGFKEVKEKVFQVPIGTWPKDVGFKTLGQLGRVIASEGTEAMAIAFFTRVLGMEEGEARSLCKEASREYKDNKVHTVYHMNIMYAQKPGK
ncbi:S-adenosyl-L-methionine-dependent methyltransferase [Ascobolus immersus RN42]|uniref:S-adenosyl-L-methionine-dependent methyltransferase n=1 Tax=Ascobolus immersus RN42 TaxID=1160509 RepID=A0A3N4I1V1_ASCIM|nr:S-adenosyl-L-methionine-dependent methyltransferase [Ascobolus immersus RN42]